MKRQSGTNETNQGGFSLIYIREEQKMAYIVIQFGQCGNQLGKELFSLVHDDISQSDFSYWNNTCARDFWFDHNSAGELKARAILVDTERKVITASLNNKQRKSLWMFRSSNVVSSSDGGAGNNFALGYNVKGPEVRDATLEILRKESEKCDRVGGIISIAGCAGGTGSGVGTFVLEQFKEINPNKNLVSVLVTPYCSGEVVTQNKNMLFTISKQNVICDALIFFENDRVTNTLRPGSQSGNEIAFPEINRVISQTLLSFLQPLQYCGRSLDLYDVLSKICPQSQFKLLSVVNFPSVQIPKSKFEFQPSWTSIEREVIRCIKSYLTTPNEIYLKSLTNMIISRGESIPSRTVSKIESQFSYPVWIPENQRSYQFHQPRPLLGLEKSITVINNGSNVSGLLDSSIVKAWKLFTNNMYVHLYYKFGFTKDDFLDMFANCEEVLKNYRSF